MRFEASNFVLRIFLLVPSCLFVGKILQRRLFFPSREVDSAPPTSVGSLRSLNSASTVGSRRFLAAIVVIPARFGSTRFPAKILASETGKPLVQHVVDQAKKCWRVDRVIVATDDSRIQAALRPFDTRW